MADNVSLIPGRWAGKTGVSHIHNAVIIRCGQACLISISRSLASSAREGHVWRNHRAVTHFVRAGVITVGWRIIVTAVRKNLPASDERHSRYR